MVRPKERRGGEVSLEDAEDGLVGAGAGCSGRRGGGWGREERRCERVWVVLRVRSAAW
jgi:hypothetical protein